MSAKIDNSLLLTDLASQYATASHSVSLRLLTYALQAFPRDDYFEVCPSRSGADNVSILRLWADILVSRGDNSRSATVWKQIALWCHSLQDYTGAATALVQAHTLMLDAIPPQDALETATGLINMLAQLPPSRDKTTALVLLASSLTKLGDISAAQILQAEAAKTNPELRLETSILQLRILCAQEQREALDFLLADLEDNLSIFPDPQGAKLALGFFRLYRMKTQENWIGAAQTASELLECTRAEGLLLPQAVLFLELAQSFSQLGDDHRVIEAGIQALKLCDRLNLGETLRISLKALLASSLYRLGRPQKGIEYAEQVAAWAHLHDNQHIEQRFTVIAAELCALDLQSIRAAGLYGSAADLYHEQPLLRSMFLRKCAIQLVASAGEDRESTLNWAMSLLQEAGELLHSLPKSAETAREISAWTFDRLWIRTRR